MRYPQPIGTRITAAIIGALIVAGCTPAQLDRWEQATGQHLGTEVRAALVALPDRPMATPDGQLVMADGTIGTTAATGGPCAEQRQTLIDAGWPSHALGWAQGVMWRESRCNTAAISRWGDYGRMQINRIVVADMRQRPGLWADTINRLGGVPTLTELLDPAVNVVVALGLYHIRGTQPWT